MQTIVYHMNVKDNLLYKNPWPTSITHSGCSDDVYAQSCRSLTKGSARLELMNTSGQRAVKWLIDLYSVMSWPIFVQNTRFITSKRWRTRWQPRGFKNTVRGILKLSNHSTTPVSPCMSFLSEVTEWEAYGLNKNQKPDQKVLVLV